MKYLRTVMHVWNLSVKHLELLQKYIIFANDIGVQYVGGNQSEVK